jgi:homoserine dehydrogenase
MSRAPESNTVVYKFGSSVLDGAEGFRGAAEQVRGEVGRGRKVVAVVSATPGTTDRLSRAAYDLTVEPQPDDLCWLLATGEHASVHLLSIALQAKGIAAAALTSTALGLRTAGPALDADPAEVDADALRRHLDDARAVVVPGFLGHAADGSPSLLGRGGSDLTALFLSHALGAECCLVKDVDGLYDGDPNGTSSRPPWRYLGASWDELDRVGDVVVQPKAVAFARDHGLGFRIAALGGRGTMIGAGPNVMDGALDAAIGEVPARVAVAS